MQNKKVRNLSSDPYLGHESIRSRPFLVFEHNIGVVVGHEVAELGALAVDRAFRKARGGKTPLRKVGDVLLVDERGHFPAPAPPDHPPSGTAAGGGLKHAQHCYGTQ